MWIGLNEEVCEGPIDRDGVSLHPTDPRTPWSSPCPRDEVIDSLALPLREELNASVGEIADPADEIKCPGGASTCLSVPDLLHQAAHKAMDGLHGDRV